MNELDKFWIECYKKAQDMWLLGKGKRPEVYDEAGETIEYFFAYCQGFANACVEDFNFRVNQI